VSLIKGKMENPITNNNSSNSQLAPEIKIEKNSKFESFFAGEKTLKIIQKLDSFFIKLPHLPKKLTRFISNIVPWIALVSGVSSAIVAVLSLALALLSLIAFDLALILEMTGTFIFILLSTLLLIRAFKPLRAKNAVGWIYLFWANVLGVINSAVNLINGNDGLILTILGILLGFYLLFEIGPFYVYKKAEK
jgi:hypothetical protein